MKPATLTLFSLCDDGVHLRTAGRPGAMAGEPTAVSASRRPPPPSSLTIMKAKKIAGGLQDVKFQLGLREELVRRRRHHNHRLWHSRDPLGPIWNDFGTLRRKRGHHQRRERGRRRRRRPGVYGSGRGALVSPQPHAVEVETHEVSLFYCTLSISLQSLQRLL